MGGALTWLHPLDIVIGVLDMISDERERHGGVKFENRAELNLTYGLIFSLDNPIERVDVSLALAELFGDAR